MGSVVIKIITEEKKSKIWRDTAGEWGGRDKLLYIVDNKYEKKRNFLTFYIFIY